MKIDLHFHSRYSDGQFWPSELATRLADAGTIVAALTDHDTFSGVPAFLEAAARTGIQGVAATEIDFEDPDFGFESELLGYFPGGSYSRTDDFLRPVQEKRRLIAEAAITKGAGRWPQAGISLPGFLRHKSGLAPAPEHTPSFSMSKHDIFEYFRTIVSDLQGIPFKQFKADFFDSDPAFERTRPTLKECIAVVRADGGFPVLAHPGLQYAKKAERMKEIVSAYSGRLMQAKAAGLWGIECHAYTTRKEAAELNALVLELAGSTGLHVTFGSDFHKQAPDDYPTLGVETEHFKGWA